MDKGVGTGREENSEENREENPEGREGNPKRSEERNQRRNTGTQEGRNKANSRTTSTRTINTGTTKRSTTKKATTKQSKTRSKWKRIELTPRDWWLLRYLNEQRFLTFEQVCTLYHPLKRTDYPVDAVQKRLRKLAHFHIIERTRVYTEPRAVVLLGREGYTALYQSKRHENLSHLRTVDPRTFTHEKIVTDLRIFLRKKGIRTTWRSERILRMLTGKQAVPDADFIFRPTGERVAFELERTRKSLARYRVVFTRHLESRYAWTLYVVDDPGHLAWLFRNVLVTVERESLLKPYAQEFHRLRFVLLKKLMSQGKRCSVWFKAPGISEPQRTTLGDL